MYKAQRILIGLLLMAGFAGSCSKPAPAASQKDKLMAKKECLINEISDLVGPLLVAAAEREYEGTSPEDAVKLVKLVKVPLSGLCGVLERKEVADRDLETFLAGKLAEKDKKIFLDFLSFFISGDETDFVKDRLEEVPPEEKPAVDLAYNKMKDLVKVMKEIRELN
jgi:hypothetical protein